MSRAKLEARVLALAGEQSNYCGREEYIGRMGDNGWELREGLSRAQLKRGRYVLKKALKKRRQHRARPGSIGDRVTWALCALHSEYSIQSLKLDGKLIAERVDTQHFECHFNDYIDYTWNVGRLDLRVPPSVRLLKRLEGVDQAIRGHRLQAHMHWHSGGYVPEPI